VDNNVDDFLEAVLRADNFSDFINLIKK